MPVIAGESPEEAAPDEPETSEETAPVSAPSESASVQSPVSDVPSADTEQSAPESPAVQTGWTENVTLDGADGTIHYSYYLPGSYDGTKTYPLVVTMPGYDRMWFGADSAGTNLSWNGVQAWTKPDTELIVVSAQLTDWGDTSARQANELAEYMIENFSVDTSRVYAAGFNIVGRVNGAGEGEAARRFGFQRDRARIDTEGHRIEVRTIDRDGQIEIVGIRITRRIVADLLAVLILPF